MAWILKVEQTAGKVGVMLLAKIGINPELQTPLPCRLAVSSGNIRKMVFPQKKES